MRIDEVKPRLVIGWRAQIAEESSDLAAEGRARRRIGIEKGTKMRLIADYLKRQGKPVPAKQIIGTVRMNSNCVYSLLTRLKTKQLIKYVGYRGNRSYLWVGK